MIYDEMFCAICLCCHGRIDVWAGRMECGGIQKNNADTGAHMYQGDNKNIMFSEKKKLQQCII